MFSIHLKMCFFVFFLTGLFCGPCWQAVCESVYAVLIVHSAPMSLDTSSLQKCEGKHISITNSFHYCVALSHTMPCMCTAGNVIPWLQVRILSLYFFRVDFVFLQVLQFPGPLNYRALFLPLTWWPLEGFLLTRKKWNSFYNIFFHHPVPEFCLNTLKCQRSCHR